MNTRKNPRHNSSLLKIIPQSHLDHGLTQAHIDYILSKFADKTGFFIETVKLPDHLASLQDALYGPLVGDKPVTESAVHYAKRGERPGESRMIHKPFRETRHLTVIAGPYGSDPVVLYTAFGGKLAPKEPFDPSLNPEQKAASEAFWSKHALATGKQASKRANSSNRKTTQDFTHLSDAELDARITTASQGMQYWGGYNPSFYDMAEKEWDALTAEKKRRARPNTTVHAHDLDCPSCGAPAGYYCNSPEGKALKTPHKERRLVERMALFERHFRHLPPSELRAWLEQQRRAEHAAARLAELEEKRAAIRAERDKARAARDEARAARDEARAARHVARAQETSRRWVAPDPASIAVAMSTRPTSERTAGVPVVTTTDSRAGVPVVTATESRARFRHLEFDEPAGEPPTVAPIRMPLSKRFKNLEFDDPTPRKNGRKQARRNANVPDLSLPELDLSQFNFVGV